MRRTFTGVAVAAALTLVLAGCGGDDDDSGGTVHTTESSEPTADETTTTAEDEETTTEADETTTTSEAGPSDEEAQALVDGIDVTVEDLTEFGGSWAPEEGSDDEGDSDLDECFGATGEIEPRAESEGRTFSSQSDIVAFAGSATLLFETVEDATATMDEASTEEFRACAEEFAKEGADSARIDSYPQGTRFGEQWVVLGGVVEGTTDDGTPLSITVDINLLRNGPLVTLLLYYDLEGGEATAAVIDGLMTTLDERQVTALG